MRWTEAEDAALLRHYPRHGASWGEWEDILPRRTQTAISARANLLGARCDRTHRHTGSRRIIEGSAELAVSALDEFQRLRLKMLVQYARRREDDY